MRIVLQHLKTKQYLKGHGRWTPNPQEALAFVDAVRAHDYSVYHRLSDTVIVPLPENSGLRVAASPTVVPAGAGQT